MEARNDNPASPADLARQPNPPARQRSPVYLRFALIAWLPMLALSTAAAAKPHEARIPLKQGKVPFSEVSAVVCRELHVKAVHAPVGDLDLNGLKGSNLVTAVNGSLGDGLRVIVVPDALILHVDPDKLPKDCDSAKRAVRVFTALEAPEATTAQCRRYGLHFADPSPDSAGPAAPGEGARIDPHKPLVVLIHGLDSDCSVWGQMQALLSREGYPTATFGYPGDGPIEEGAALLARSLADLRNAHPELRDRHIDLVAHSMGGLVARAYIEGDNYAGGVDRLIMLATPNHGSSWARWRWPLGVWEQYRQYRSDPNWSATWVITDGLGEAGDELKPKSKFLKSLNARPRRPGIRYTIVAGNQPLTSRVGAEWVADISHLIPRRVSNWWGFRQCKAKLVAEADSLAHRTGRDDGVVTLKSARLDGVTDFVVLPADHITIAFGETPAAWGTIRDRLAK